MSENLAALVRARLTNLAHRGIALSASNPAALPLLLMPNHGPETPFYRLWNAFLRKIGLEHIPIEQMQQVVSDFVSVPLALAGGTASMFHKCVPDQLRWV